MPGAEMPGAAGPRRGLARRARRIRTVDDARQLARRRVPAAVFDYIDGGAEGETTLRANRRALEDITLAPRVGTTRGVPPPSLGTTVAGIPVELPVVLAPIGFTRMMHRTGDLAGAAAAGAAGTVCTLSTFSGHSLEAVAQAARGPLWFQLYFLGGRPGAQQLIRRAAEAGYAGLVVTMDTQTVGMRERDLPHGVSVPLRVTARNVVRFAPEVAARPSWLLDFARDWGGTPVSRPPATPPPRGRRTPGPVPRSATGPGRQPATGPARPVSQQPGRAVNCSAVRCSPMWRRPGTPRSRSRAPPCGTGACR